MAHKFGDQHIMQHEKEGLARDILSSKEGGDMAEGGKSLERVECETMDGGGYVVHEHHKPPEHHDKDGATMPIDHSKYHKKVAHADVEGAIDHVSTALRRHAGKHGKPHSSEPHEGM